MSYGESLGTSTLARNLECMAADIYRRIDDGEPWSEIRDDAKSLMEGAMELWERMVDDG